MKFRDIKPGQTFRDSTGTSWLRPCETNLALNVKESTAFNPDEDVELMDNPEEMLYLVTGSQMKTCEG